MVGYRYSYRSQITDLHEKKTRHLLNFPKNYISGGRTNFAGFGPSEGFDFYISRVSLSRETGYRHELFFHILRW